MTRHHITSGSTFEQEIGYSRAVVAGDWLFVSATMGFDYSRMSIPEGLLGQTEPVPEKHRLRNAAGRFQSRGRCTRHLRASERCGIS